MNVVGSSLALIFNALAGLYILAILLRFLLQLARADVYNPVSQAVIRVTNPAVRVFRNFIPGYRGLDFSSLILALVVEGISICVLILLYGGDIPSLTFVITWAFVGILYFIINIYYFAIIASIIMSFVMLFSGNMNPHPILQLVWQLTEPVMAPVRKIIPPMGGLDFSPIFIFIAIGLIQNFLVQTFQITEAIATVVIGI